MDKETRSRIQRATQAARALLELDYKEQLEGHYDIMLDGTIAPEPGEHVKKDPRDVVVRAKLVAAIEHLRAGGFSAADAVQAFRREAAFTTLNRFAALKMLEARELVRECVSKGDHSAGFKEYCGLAPGLSALPDHGYRMFIDSIFDELGREVRVLFDRRDPVSLLWPRRQAKERQPQRELLDIVNAPDLAPAWAEDETVGWIYQYFNSDDERREARESQAPRNARELAVRNQFFTPRYVVEFLADNTLGRMWYEMQRGETSLVDRCRYLVRREGETWQPRRKKDPRDLRILDPACGSGHFLLYAFDLLLVIYQEAWADPSPARAEATNRTLREDFPDLETLRRELPGLVLRRNLHGVDIDARCVQIAQLSLWVRAQRAHLDHGVRRNDRPPIRRVNIVVAEPMPREREYFDELTERTKNRALAALIEQLTERMRFAGELGLLLRLDDLTARGGSGLFTSIEEHSSEMLRSFADEPGAIARTTRRLFVEDTLSGLGLFELQNRTYDVILMNPPFGRGGLTSKDYVDTAYPSAKSDLYAVFVERALELLAPTGLIGVLSSRLGFFSAFLEDWRARCLLGGAADDPDEGEDDRPAPAGVLVAIADLGHNVLDDALVEAAAYVISGAASSRPYMWAAGFLTSADKETSLRQRSRASISSPADWHLRERLRRIAGAPIAYWLPDSVLESVFQHPTLAEADAEARWGLQTDDNFRFIRLSWEVPSSELGVRWRPLAKGGEYAPFYDDVHLVVEWKDSAACLRAFIEQKYSWSKNARSAEHYGTAGLTYSERTTSELSIRVLPEGCVFNIAGPAILPPSFEYALALLALSYSRVFRVVLEILIGGGDAVASGSAARHYKAGILNVVPVPQLPSEMGVRLTALGRKCVDAALKRLQSEETSRLFTGLETPTVDLSAFLEAELCSYEDTLVEIEAATGEADRIAMQLYRLDPEGVGFVLREYGPHTSALESEACVRDFEALFEMPMDDLVDHAGAALGYRRQTTKQAYWTDRRYELIALLGSSSVRRVVDRRRQLGLMPAWFREAQCWNIMSWIVGAAFGRWSRQGHTHVPRDPFAPLPGAPGDLIRDGNSMGERGSFVDDEGHARDLPTRVLQQAAALGLHEAVLTAVVANLGCRSVREMLRTAFWPRHLQQYSRSRRAAPVYWQFGTESGAYSIWSHCHSMTADTLYGHLNDLLIPKLRHEEALLQRLVQEAGATPSAGQRDTIFRQECLVDELRAFRTEVARVAPLWTPNLNDGAIINFAPLWRLVPQHKAWQKECKATWDALCAGEYDWAHMAMHLWPERVVPRCAEDRSLAIAHDLESVFWAEDEDGKWQPCDVSKAQIAELVGERTSPAVKAALKSLLEAPPLATGRTSRARAAPRERAPAKERPPRATRKSATAPDTEVVDKVRAALQAAADGATKKDLLEATGLPAERWTALSKMLVEQKVMRTTGRGPGTRYHLAEPAGEA